MTYCLGIRVEGGLVFASDSRTNAGMDAAGTHSKIRFYGVPGERPFILCWAGNLATTQGVVTQIERDMRDKAPVSLLTVNNMAQQAMTPLGIILSGLLADHYFEPAMATGGTLHSIFAPLVGSGRQSPSIAKSFHCCCG